ncbi:PRC-barrel domain-containing protein [Gloeocapsa sp. PCC 73106]|uniref:PRC-barrel domain-containing protein n=1 Tax=Gloeocapsa sp. PCC 73106 TaxID=102232 RepID=UPI0002ACDA54|nr:PRC-barrel domain-containing protein [Gloeocapsa sp. PCC 73106]ELR96690.1 hypothetical protein GLO73106DRAFT_00004870 [Gloeocapsa sp. PCC 73106]
MPLHKIKDFDPNYRKHFQTKDIIGYDLYVNADHIGSVNDILVDDGGKIRYLIINMGIWIFGKKILLPIGRTRINEKAHRVTVDGLTPSQIKSLPKYDENISIDYDYEEQIRNVYRPKSNNAISLNRNTYNYDDEGALYDLNDSTHQSLRLYQEGLIKTGDVAVDKQEETEITPRERVVMEQSTASNAKVTPDDTVFDEGETEPSLTSDPEIDEEAFVSEEVTTTEEIYSEIVDAQVIPDDMVFHRGEIQSLFAYDEEVREETTSREEIYSEIVDAQEVMQSKQLENDKQDQPVVKKDLAPNDSQDLNTPLEISKQ